jgi:hypothetical protein
MKYKSAHLGFYHLFESYWRFLFCILDLECNQLVSKISNHFIAWLSVSLLLKSLGIPTPRSSHYHVLGPSLICLSPQVSLATKCLASHEYSIEYHFYTVSLEEHQKSSTHNSRGLYSSILSIKFSLQFFRIQK